MNPRQYVRAYGYLRIVKGSFSQNLAGADIQKAQDNPAGSQINGQTGNRSAVFCLGNPCQEPLPAIFEKHTADMIIPFSENIRQVL